MTLDSSRSATSDSKAKRSLISTTSSNPSELTSSNGTKKRKTEKKTLGMAWGSNSLSVSRSSFRKAPFSDFGSYMAMKNQKLQNQFDAEASSSSCGGSDLEKPIFHGISIFVDGFTVPSSQELRGFMLKYGGRFENYFSRHHVTHIICSNLPDSKLKNLRSFSAGLPVVKPSWVLDSVVANKLLSWVPYQLDQLVTLNQPKLSAFFAIKSGEVSENLCQVNSGIEDLNRKGNTLKVTNPPELGESVNMTKQCSGESDSTHNNGGYSEENMDRSGHTGPRETSVKLNKKESQSSSTVGPSHHQHHSTLGDPNFVENFFKNSRLHFIGTWRNRYRKRFPSLSNEFKCSDTSASATSEKNAVIHVDMDCFFVSVIIRNNPELQDKPVAVCHSDNPKGTAEISSANYPARDYGIKAGIFVRDAKARCPHLVIVPYNFEAYEEVADQFYNILHRHCNKVQAVSCDEAFLDVTDTQEDPEVIASTIRKEIFETTGCKASAGIAGNLLMARLATRSAKPDGQCYIPPDKVDDYLHELPIKALPGIGHILEEKLKRRGIQTCGQLRTIAKESLQKDFGSKIGDMLWNYSRGIDSRLVGMIQESKSIGAEVNWGVRFNDLRDCHVFLVNLCKEVSLRLQGCGMQGRRFTLKIKKRRKDADEPAKFMGCGDCENLSHSATVPIATGDVDVLQRITKQLFGSFNMDVKEIRGVGLQVSKLENADTVKQGHGRNSLTSWLNSASATTKQCEVSSPDKERASGGDCERDQTSENLEQLSSDSALPPLSHLDVEVIESLPPELFSELNAMYGGKLVDFMAGRRVKNEHSTSSLCAISSSGAEGMNCMINKEEDRPLAETVKNQETLYRHVGTERTVPQFPEDVKMNQSPHEEIQAVHVSESGSLNAVEPNSAHSKINLMPLSVSQIDSSVLNELPEDLRANILEVLPPHRKPEECYSEHTKSEGSVSKGNLWFGNPPAWIVKFKASRCLILKIIAEKYYGLGLNGQLSSVLQGLISDSRFPLNARHDEWDEAISSFCELLKQYIKLKIDSDIEEIYVCFCLLRRLTIKSNLFLQVYKTVFPYLQASVSEIYEGNLQIPQLRTAVGIHEEDELAVMNEVSAA